MNAHDPDGSKVNLLQQIQKWRARLSPAAGAIIVAVFLYWIWSYRGQIVATYGKIGGVPLLGIAALMIASIVLSVIAFTSLVQGKGYSFGFADGYHSLNLSQLAAMLPGGIWGYAGLAGVLWSKGVSKADSIIVIVFYTIITLSACAIVGISGLIAIVGWAYAVICLLPFVLLVFGRRWLDRIRRRLFPETSPLPATKTSLRVLLLALAVWIISAASFTWLLYASEGFGVIPFWVAAGAYAAGYLGGYIAIFAPAGLGVSEGLVSLMLGPYIGVSKVLTIAISFRIIQTVLVWCNILITVIITSRQAGRTTTNTPSPK